METNIISKMVLVIGGAGCSGSNLCEEALHRSYEVVCIDNFSTVKSGNISAVLSNSNFTLIEGDIRNLDDGLKARQEIYYVLHQTEIG